MHVAVARALETAVGAREEALGHVERVAAIRVVAEVEREGRQPRAAFAVDHVVAVVLGIQIHEVAMHVLRPPFSHPVSGRLRVRYAYSDREKFSVPS